MNLVYECNECKKTWNELKSECPDCGSEEYTVIQDDGDPASSFWKWAVIIGISAVAVGAVCFFLCDRIDPPPVCVDCPWEFKVVQELDNYFVFESNYDALVFKSLENGQELTVYGNNVYPCISGEYTVVNSKKKEDRTFYFQIDGEPHSDACNCNCSDLLSFSADSKCNYTAKSTSQECNESLMISFDKKKWYVEGDLKFKKSEVGKHLNLYYKFSCMPGENIKQYSFPICEVKKGKPAPSKEELNLFLDEEYNKTSKKLRHVYGEHMYNGGSGSNGIFHYRNTAGDKGPHEFNDLILFDLEDIMKSDPDFAISSVEYNQDSTRILMLKFNNL